MPYDATPQCIWTVWLDKLQRKAVAIWKQIVTTRELSWMWYWHRNMFYAIRVASRSLRNRSNWEFQLYIFSTALTIWNITFIVFCTQQASCVDDIQKMSMALTAYSQQNLPFSFQIFPKIYGALIIHCISNQVCFFRRPHLQLCI
jgi:hypothetical protein